MVNSHDQSCWRLKTPIVNYRIGYKSCITSSPSHDLFTRLEAMHSKWKELGQGLGNYNVAIVAVLRLEPTELAFLLMQNQNVLAFHTSLLCQKPKYNYNSMTQSSLGIIPNAVLCNLVASGLPTTKFSKLENSVSTSLSNEEPWMTAITVPLSTSSVK